MDTSRRSRKESVKDLFALHSAERRGFLVLMALLVFASLAVWYVKFVHRPPEVDLSELDRSMQEWVALQAQARQDSVPASEPFPFDPNTIERADWLALGLTDRQVDGLERFMAKGGRFLTKKDLARMYSIRPDQYARLEPFILLPDSLPRRTNYRERKGGGIVERREAAAPAAPVRNIPPVKVEVNTADSATLVALRGIGPTFARGIIKYRDRLGGFVSLDQLTEVYVLRDKPDAIARLKELLTVDPAHVRRIAINSCTVDELAHHPYMSWKLARPLIAYRGQHGPFTELEGIKECAVITDSLYQRLAPYLMLE
jgi:competence protein ComEA